MPKKGTYTALQQLRPYQEDFGQIALDAADRLEAQRGEKKAADAAAKKAKAAISENFGSDYDGLFEVVTRTKSIDEAYGRGINSARDAMGQLHKDIQANPSLANDAKTQMKRANLNKFSKNLKTISESYTQYAGNVGKGMRDGTLSNWNSDALSDIDSIFRQANLDIRVDQETGLPIAVIAELNDDGEATGNLKELNLIEVLDGRGLTDTVNTFDFQSSITDIGDKLGKREVKTSSGFSHIEYQKFADIEPEVRTMLKGFIGNENNPSDIAKSIWSDMMAQNPKELDATDMKRIEDFYVNSVKGFYDEKNKKTTDFGAQERRRAGRAKEEEEEEAGLGLQIRTDEQGQPLRKGLTGVAGAHGPAYSFTLPQDITLGVKGEKTLIDNLYLTDDGKIAYSGRAFKGKTSGKRIDADNYLSGTYSGEVVEDITGGGLSTNELNDIARDLGYANTGALKKELQAARDRALQGGDSNTLDTSKYN
jgi:hypothetical protein